VILWDTYENHIIKGLAKSNYFIKGALKKNLALDLQQSSPLHHLLKKAI
jgi:hypothetical protein